ncbi:amino acid ABC transporter permease [Bacillaceae bacterium SIJ1]|uniref:amino acid ABC transporter permease n=1 Tax=Litoribacterium kuwaitense TaxID=1398745 RepID=UPI0013EC1C9E|nr:amino acid ABC transporter permease [Litoribacterium kuwaitense]NGP46455.1 amino acid ABC transporter permease [Litoribacterium kuwaitense]
MDLSFFIKALGIAFSGVPLALFVTCVALLIAVPLGFALALVRLYRFPILRSFAKFYVSFVRGTPILIQIFILYSSIPLILTSIFEQFSVPVAVYDIHPIWYAFIIFSFNTTAILAEVFRGALQTVPNGQLEAAHSVGLTTSQAYRRIVIPQMLVAATPNLCTATVNLIKATSLGYAISLPEITLRTKVAANVGYHYVEAYVAIFIVYLIICLLVEYAFKRTERHLRRYEGGVIC